MTAPDPETIRCVLQELYNEVRSYRDKEAQSFFFTFPIVGAGFLEPLSGNASVKSLLSLLAIFVIYYLGQNLRRSIAIRQAIGALQTRLGVTDDVLMPLKPSKWASPTKVRHLGTGLYILILAGETIALWFA